MGVGMGLAGRAQRRVALWRRLKGGKGYRVFAGVSVASCLAASAALVVSGGAHILFTPPLSFTRASTRLLHRCSPPVRKTETHFFLPYRGVRASHVERVYVRVMRA